jgi:hypothetical protein
MESALSLEFAMYSDYLSTPFRPTIAKVRWRAKATYIGSGWNREISDILRRKPHFLGLFQAVLHRRKASVRQAFNDLKLFPTHTDNRFG